MPEPADSNRRTALSSPCEGTCRPLPPRTESPGTRQSPHLGAAVDPNSESRTAPSAARRPAELLCASGSIVRSAEAWNIARQPLRPSNRQCLSVVQSITSGERHDLVPGGTFPQYATTGHVLYVQAGTGTMMAAPFDSQRLLPVVEGVVETGVGGGAQLAHRLILNSGGLRCSAANQARGGDAGDITG